MISVEEFEAVEVRVGKIIHAEPFPEARKPAYKLQIDFGEFGVRRSSAQITALYTPEVLIGKEILAVMNFPPRQIANFFSEVLVLGVYDTEGRVILITPDSDAPLGTRLR